MSIIAKIDVNVSMHVYFYKIVSIHVIFSLCASVSISILDLVHDLQHFVALKIDVF